jgi:hypothetical protein
VFQIKADEKGQPLVRAKYRGTWTEWTEPYFVPSDKAESIAKQLVAKREVL